MPCLVSTRTATHDGHLWLTLSLSGDSYEISVEKLANNLQGKKPTYQALRWPLNTVYVTGNDTITMNASITTRMLASGGNGNDTIQGGGGNDLIFGANGNDRIRGGRTMTRSRECLGSPAIGIRGSVS